MAQASPWAAPGSPSSKIISSPMARSSSPKPSAPTWAWTKSENRKWAQQMKFLARREAVVPFSIFNFPIFKLRGGTSKHFRPSRKGRAARRLERDGEGLGGDAFRHLRHPMSRVARGRIEDARAD